MSIEKELAERAERLIRRGGYTAADIAKATGLDQRTVDRHRQRVREGRQVRQHHEGCKCQQKQHHPWSAEDTALYNERVRLLKEGLLKPPEIARLTGVSARAVYRLRLQLRATESTMDTEEGG